MRQLSLLDPIKIPLTKGCVALVDPCDADLVNDKWTAKVDPTNKYAQRAIRINGKSTTQMMHRLIFSRVLNRPLLREEEIDHIDCDGLNNRRANLRLATHAENVRNVRRRSNNTTGFKGIYLHKASGMWWAVIKASGKNKYLGQFKTPEEAHAAYCKAATKYFGEFARFE